MENTTFTADETGRTVCLRLAQPTDNPFIFSIRNNPALNTFLGGTPATIVDQYAWFCQYVNRNAKGSEYYFIVCRSSDMEPYGLVRLYDITSHRCTWGSWVLKSDRPRGAAIESAYLSFLFGFDRLHLARIDLTVHKKNKRALQLYLLFGFEQQAETEEEIGMSLTASAFRGMAERWSFLLQQPAPSRAL